MRVRKMCRCRHDRNAHENTSTGKNKGKQVIKYLWCSFADCQCQKYREAK